MSNVIPIVSSSPPPLEDTGGFDDWGDDDDFGGFMGADVTQNTWNNSQSNQTSDEVNANFSKQIPQNTERIENCSPLTLNLDKSLPYNSNISSGENLNNKSVREFHDNKNLTESGNSTGDSGLFDASPIPISEDTKSDNSDSSPDNDAFRETPDNIPDQFTIDTNTNSGHENQNLFDNKQLKGDENDKTCKCDIENESMRNCNFNSSPDSIELITDSQNTDTDRVILTDDDALSNSCSSLTNDNSMSSNETNSSPERKFAIETSASQKIEGIANESLCQSVDSRNDAPDIKLEHSSEVICHDKPDKESSQSVTLDEDVNRGFEVNVSENEKESSDFHLSTNCVQNKIDEEKACLSEEDISFKDDNCDYKVDSDNDEFANFKETKNKEEDITSDSGSQKQSLNLEEKDENKVDDLKSDSDLSNKEESVGDQTDSNEEFRKVNSEQKLENGENTNLHSVQTKDTGDEFADPSSDNENEFADFSSAKMKGKDDDFADFSSTKTFRNEDEFAEFSAAKTKDNEDEFADFNSTKVKGNEDEFADSSSVKTMGDEDEFANFNSAAKTEENEDEFANVNSAAKTEENDDECADFKSSKSSGNEDEIADFSSAKTMDNDNEFADFNSTQTKVKEDEFADFNSAKTSGNKDEFADFGSTTNEEDEDRFADFSTTKATGNTEEFTDFSTTKVTGNTEEFTDFSTTKATGNTEEFTDFSSTNKNEKDDGFADFSCAQQKEKQSTSCENIESDGPFAKFSSEKDYQEQEEFATFASSKSNENESEFGNFAENNFESDDDFADFSSAQNDSKGADLSSAESQSNVQGGPSFSNETDSSSTFHHTNTTIPSSKPTQSVFKADAVCSTISECYQESVIVSEQTTDLDIIIQEKNVLWMKLQKTDNTAMVKWPQFSSNKNLFVSLKIDTKNILLGYKKPTVPIYAANLTLLEPTKGLPVLQPEVTLVDTNKQEEVKDLPPVQFDWTSSGLTNPLELNSKLQQLDFLTVDESDLSERSKVFDSAIGHGQRASMQPLQNILANLRVTKKTKLEDLSNEAGRVISHLPDLSFMKAKVLMFPLKQNDL